MPTHSPQQESRSAANRDWGGVDSVETDPRKGHPPSPPRRHPRCSWQLCAGHECGVEAAIHAMHTVFEDEETEAILLADASNAFNTLNREACMRNIQHLCPAMSPIVINTYRQLAHLFVGGETILSSEGTTQGDPTAMPMYALGVLPLLKSVATPGAIQEWFADDAGAGGKLMPLRRWWGGLTENGPSYGYNLNPAKSILLVTPAYLDRAEELFASTGVKIRTEGCQYLGAAIGSPQFAEHFLSDKVQSWPGQVNRLSNIAMSQPHAAYSAFTQALKGKWAFICRTMPTTAIAMEPLEKVIADTLIPAITGQTINSEDRGVLSLPCRHGGLGMVSPTELSDQYNGSRHVTQSLQRNIVTQRFELGGMVELRMLCGLPKERYDPAPVMLPVPSLLSCEHL
eukprot:scpid31728/ scgid3499/ 